MKDVMQVADTRKSNLLSEIEKREAEITEMREEIESLDEFMAYGQSLMERGEEASVSERPKAQPSPKLAESLNALKASEDEDDETFSDEDEADDEFNTMADDEELSKSIAQLRPRSRPISRPA